MFFSEDLLTSKKGTLAATLGPRSKKITKKELTSVDLAKTCHLIAEPPEPLALRLSGSLLVGVTRVYNQNYDVFYSDVTNFHQTLRRSIVTDFATTTGNIPAGHVNLDLPGGGKSKRVEFDVITFPNAGIDLDFGLDLRFQHIDWQNPLSIGRKRRASSKLSSQATQEGSADESDEENEDSEVEEIGRDAKRKKYSSSPFIGATTISKARNSVHHPSEPTGALYAGIDMPIGEIDLGLDLEGMNDAMPDDSFSAPSGRGFELPAAGDEAIDITIDKYSDLIPPSRQGSAGPVEHFSPPPELAVTSPNSGNRRSADALLSDEGSVGDVENQLDVPKPKKVRKVKKVTFDSNIELSSGQDAGARQQYRDMMDDQRQAVEIKSREKAVEARASALVDSTGGLEFLDPDMQSFFSTFTQVKSFKWETEATVNRLVSGPQEPELQDNGRQQNQYDLAGENGDMPTGMDTFQSYDVPIHELSASARQGSLAPDMEYARRYSQGSQQGPLPVSRINVVSLGFVELGDTSFSPASLRLSIMTPQEAKLRSRSHPNSSGPASLARRRNRSSSLMSDRPDDDPLLLVQGDDLELPDNEVELQLESLAASQQARLADLPQAFRPEMLATLETQCRDFFTFVEKKMVTLSIDELDFEDIAPVENTKHVAAVAFYDCLNLATKKILAVNQEEPWGPITVRFAVDSN
uniref:Rad21/Rec8-like protein N-terminal domain-containing protein n=1 Tax=Kwoniella dejecticola CBS 10117 TaxID=1296121 RepID=A0A1A5ZZH7_9TREE|nr:uncharacterized protein I303_06770 [Kwoniella dejecticola CBS 10117]OBR83211.1 hypothetical protein I303_06770 [Kwoniella dejecticola CBS 10117]